jgi:hypothetical protein
VQLLRHDRETGVLQRAADGTTNFTTLGT